MWKVFFFFRKVLDEEEMVNVIVEWDIWLFVIKLEFECWFDLELVVEEFSFVFIWREMVNEM